MPGVYRIKRAGIDTNPLGSFHYGLLPVPDGSELDTPLGASEKRNEPYMKYGD
jgi:hypothetical protein